MKKQVILGAFTVIIGLLNAAVDIQTGSAGYFYTDINESKIYHYDGQVSEIVSGPGVGYFYQLSPDGTKLGFKLMDAPGALQSPAIYNIESGKIIRLHSPVDACGQVFFSNAGHIVYTVGKTLFVKYNDSISKYDLGTYCNLTPVSPDGRYVVFNDENDQLHILNTQNRSIKQITRGDGAHVEPGWSPDGRYVYFYELDGSAHFYNIVTRKIIDLGTVSGIRWHENASKVLFTRNRFGDDFSVTEMQVVEYRLSDGSETILSEKDKKAYNPFYDLSGHPAYRTEEKGLRTRDPLLFDELTENPVYFDNSTQNKVSVLDIPYIHQVYDTPGSYGYSSCGPTTAAMVLAYYEILPEWPYRSGYNHWNDYGAYVHKKYYYYDYFFDLTYSSSSYSCQGGMGYMWSGGSPNSRMAGYYSRHGVSTYQTWNTDWSRVKSSIDAGQPFSMCVWLTGAGHLIAATGRVEESGQRTVIANDPYGNKNTAGYPSYDGKNSYYDWPGYNHGYVKLDAGNTGASGSAVPWCIKTTYSCPAPCDSLVDDRQLRTGFNLYARDETVPMRYYHSSRSGYDGHHWWTYTEDEASDICHVLWTPSLDQSGFYEIFAYIPENASAIAAPYRISHAGGETIKRLDQNEYTDEWVSLGKYLFSKDLPHSVYLGDSTGVSGEIIVYDALKWCTDSDGPIDFSANMRTVQAKSHINFTGITRCPEGNYTYQWNFGDGGTAEGLSVYHAYNSPGNYSVSLTIEAQGVSKTITKENYIFVISAQEPDFSLLSPVADEIMQTRTPEFLWESAENTDRYLIYFGEQLNIGLDTPAVADTASWISDDSLAENASYYWHVKAVLISGDTLHSDFQSFKVNAVNEAPFTFDLKGPSNHVILDTDTPVVDWMPTFDPDPDDSVHYNLFAGMTQDDLACVYSGDSSAYRFRPGELEENGTYIWYVKAVDTFGAEKICSDSIRTFSVNTVNEAPFAVILKAPVSDVHIDSLYPNFIWTQAQDPDPGDEISYKAYVWFAGSSYMNTFITNDTCYNRKKLYDKKNYYWTIASIDGDGSKTYSDTCTFRIDTDVSVANIPEKYELGNNYPNPFNPVTTIPFTLPQRSHVVISLFNIHGEHVKTVVNNHFEAGIYHIRLDANDLSSGMYICRMSTGSYEHATKLLLMK